MKTLIVYYSKTGTTKKVAETVIQNLQCDFDELQYDEKKKRFKLLVTLRIMNVSYFFLRFGPFRWQNL